VGLHLGLTKLKNAAASGKMQPSCPSLPPALHEFALRKKLIPGRSKVKSKDIRNAIESNSELLQNEKTMLANAVSDKLKQAKFLMANATEGHFPDDRPHPWAQTRQRTSKG
jgi:hypothetical protein